MKIKKLQYGFTLIELLVVIAIIAILAVLIIIRLTSTQADARDSSRLHGMDQITQALEMYKLKYGGYFNDDGDHNGWDASCNPDSEFLVPNPGYLPNAPLIPDFLPEAPVDPINKDEDWDGFCYRYARRWADANGCVDPDGKDGYILGIKDMEGSDRPHPQSPGFGCNIDYDDPLGPMSDECLDDAEPCRNFQREFDWVTGE